jgi:hypothetical protein
MQRDRIDAVKPGTALLSVQIRSTGWQQSRGWDDRAAPSQVRRALAELRIELRILPQF